MKVITSKSKAERIKKVRKAIHSTGNFIGAVTFVKRSTGEIRSMAYRLHCVNPSCATKPTLKGHRKTVAKDNGNTQITVLDVNKPVKNRKGHVIGRGAWRSIPLENVLRIKARNVIYRVPIDLIRA